MTGAAAGLSLLAGLAGAIQVAVMGRFGARIGVIEALVAATGIQLVLATSILLVSRRSDGGIGGAFHVPPWMLMGGLMGLVVVLSITYSQPRIGAAATIGILTGGQLLMGAVIDQFGLFGSDRIVLSWPRAAGLLLLAAGSALSLSR